MKEDLKIEELFKQKFENFEGNVDPSAWANISQSIGAGATGAGAAGATGGLSGFAKVAIIVGAAAITAVGVWQFGGDTEEEINNENNTTVSDNTINDQDNSNDEIGTTDNSNNVVEHGNNDVTDIVNESNESDENISLVNENAESNNDDNSHSETADNQNNSDTQNNHESDNETNSDQSANEHQENETDQDNQTEENHYSEAPELSANPEFSVDGNEVSFISNAVNGDKVVWDLGDGNTRPGDQLNYTYEKPGTYNVKVTVSQFQNGRKQQKNYTLKVEVRGTSSISKVPNVFTPNGDNNNDYFFIQSEDIKEFNIVIVDLSGNEVYQSTDVNFKWNGENYEGAINKGRHFYQIYAVGNDGSEIRLSGPIQINL